MRFSWCSHKNETNQNHARAFGNYLSKEYIIGLQYLTRVAVAAVQARNVRGAGRTDADRGPSAGIEEEN